MNFTKREQVVIIVVVCLIVFLSFMKIFNPSFKKEDEDITDLDIEGQDLEDVLEETSIGKEDEEVEEFDIIIHVAGAVENPGILKLESGSRVIDAIELSGGLLEDANIDSINLARKLSDEEKLYVPRDGEEIIEGQEDVVVGEGQDNNLVIDINTSTREELMTLPGIGEKTADKIIDYREGNIFKTIDDIKNVSGIGEKKFEAIKDLIKVK